jgi:hypothetical protein
MEDKRCDSGFSSKPPFIIDFEIKGGIIVGTYL